MIIEKTNKNSQSKLREANDVNSQEKQNIDRNNSFNSMGKLPLRRRKRLFIIAMDYYDGSGEPLVSKIAIIIQEIMNAVRSARNFPSPGFILSTALTVSETLYVLQSIGVKLSAFDALICSSAPETTSI